MSVRWFLTPLLCIAFTLTAFSGVFPACTQEECNEVNDPGCTARAMRAYDDCRRREQVEREVRDAARRERREQAGKEAAQEAEKGQEKTNYPFMDDIREINKSRTKW